MKVKEKVGMQGARKGRERGRRGDRKQKREREGDAWASENEGLGYRPLPVFI